MVQWVNRPRNNSFVKATGLPLLCCISGAVHLAEPSLTAGWLAGRRNPDDFLKFIIDQNNRHFALLNKCKALL